MCLYLQTKIKLFSENIGNILYVHLSVKIRFKRINKSQILDFTAFYNMSGIYNYSGNGLVKSASKTLQTSTVIHEVSPVLCMLNNQLLIMECDHPFRRKSSWHVSVRSVTEVMLRWVSFPTTKQLKTSGLITALNIHCKNPTTAKYRWLINKT